MRGGRGSMEGEGCKNRSRRNGSTGVFSKRGAIVKVKVIRNYDLGEYQSKRVRSRRRYSNCGDRATETERRRDRERRERRKWKRQLRKEGEKENSGKETRSPSWRKLAKLVVWLLLKIASLPRQRGNFPKILTAFIEMRFFTRATGVIPTFLPRPVPILPECTEETVQPDRVCMILYTYFLVCIYILAPSIWSARV